MIVVHDGDDDNSNDGNDHAKATIVIWEPMSLVCAVLTTIRMYINDSDINWYKIGLLLEWAGQERPMRQKASS